MRLEKVCAITLVVSLSLAVRAQTGPAPLHGSSDAAAPALEVSLGYNYFHSNAPPSSCGCFSLNGGYGRLVYYFNPDWSVVGDFATAHAGNVGGTTQSITTFDYLFGPRYTFTSVKKIAPYGQALFGGAKEFSNFAYVQNASAFGLSIGGGIDTTIHRRIGWNIVEADWTYTRLPNGVNTHQNLLRVSTGINLRFGHR